MKLFKTFLILFSVICLVGCGPKYSESKCEILEEKINDANRDPEELSNQDISDIISQYHAVTKEMCNYLLKEIKEGMDSEDIAAVYKDDYYETLKGYQILFEEILKKAENEDVLTSSNKKKWKSVKKKVYELVVKTNYQLTIRRGEDNDYELKLLYGL